MDTNDLLLENCVAPCLDHICNRCNLDGDTHQGRHVIVSLVSTQTIYAQLSFILGGQAGLVTEALCFGGDYDFRDSLCIGDSFTKPNWLNWCYL